MPRKRIAIACQGGGSQTAFTAGVLKSLFDDRFEDRYEVIGLSGTSGGAINAALVWYGLLKRAHGDATPIQERIVACWETMTAQTPMERFVDMFWLQLLRLADRGVIRLPNTSPYDPAWQVASVLVPYQLSRREFTDLRAVLQRYIDFSELDALVGPQSPVLLISAADVLNGKVRIFNSRNREICADAILASAAVPSLFRAVKGDGGFFWDGLFASNPPVIPFVRRPFVGTGNYPQEIWIIQINPFERATVPTLPNEISDRRNQMVGNIGLLQELETLDLLNHIMVHGGFAPWMLDELGFSAQEPVAVRHITMSPELQCSLDYPSKLSRQPRHIRRLMEDGARQGHAFLDGLDRPD